MSFLESFIHENPFSLDLLQDHIQEKHLKREKVFRENCVLSLDELQLFGLEDLYNNQEKVNEKNFIEQSIEDLTTTITKLKEDLQNINGSRKESPSNQMNVNDNNVDLRKTFDETIEEILHLILLNGLRICGLVLSFFGNLKSLPILQALVLGLDELGQLAIE